MKSFEGEQPSFQPTDTSLPHTKEYIHISLGRSIIAHILSNGLYGLYPVKPFW